MTVVGLHPEELFDKLLDGELSPSDAERLRQHLSSCRVCRFEHAARLDFQAEALELAGPPPALPLRPLPWGGLVEEARVGQTPAPTPIALHRRRRSRALVWGLAAAALISASGALAASMARGKAPWRGLGMLFSESAQPDAPAKVGRAKAPKTVQATPLTAGEASTPAAPSPGSSAVALLATAPRQAPHAVARSGPKLGSAAVVPTATAPLPVTDTVDKDSGKQLPSAAKLFSEANEARRSGNIGRASGLYRLLQDQYPGSPEAELSRVTLSLLLLDGGDAQAALVGFERYLAGSSRGLEAEALVGRARALGRLGRRDLEATAWREVQRKYPSSIYGRQATERLSALGQR